MYILKNAWKSIVRNKGRNLLIGIVALVIAISSCVSLSIREAAETAKADTLADMSVTAQISYDRSKAMNEMKQSSSNTESSSTEKPTMDLSKLKGESLTLAQYKTYTKAQSSGDSYYYSNSASLNGTDSFEKYDSSSDTESSSSSNTESSSTNATMPNMQGGGDMGGKGGMAFSAQGDFSITGYSSYDAMSSLFGDDGTCSISSGSMFDETATTAQCVISDELAMLNDVEVGDKITLTNPNYEDETYTLTVCGIYKNSSSDEGNSQFAMSDPANNIYMNYNALQTIITSSEKAGSTFTNDNSEEQSAALTSEINFTYVFSEAAHYYTFEDKVYDLGLSDEYQVSSTDISAFEESLTPLETLSTMAGWFFIVVLAIGGIILVVLNIFNLRERKYEVGVLTAIGMKKRKVATQFVCELLTVTFVAMILGSCVGAGVSVPITNALLEKQISSSESQTQTTNDNFGFSSSNTESSNSGTQDFGGKMNGQKGGPNGVATKAVSYVKSVSSATDFVVILELFALAIFLTIISSLAAVVTIMRYEPLKILSNRS